MAWHGMAADIETNTNHLFNNHSLILLLYASVPFFLISQFCHVAEVVINDPL
jgi:hypothetical protein